MSGVKASLAGAPHSVDAVGKPAANAGRNEPSIDEILASIRQVISEQNRQADEAAAKAAAEVANKQENPDKIESIIGPMSAGDMTANSAPTPQAGEFKAPEIVVSDNIQTAPATKVEPNVEVELKAQVEPKTQIEPKTQANGIKNSAHLTELEELIQLIGSAPTAPRPAKSQSVGVPKEAVTLDLATGAGITAQGTGVHSVEGKVSGKITAEAAPTTTENNGEKHPSISLYKVFRRGDKSLNKKAAVVLPKETAIRRDAVELKGRLHPSISPKSEVPQVIKDAMGQMSDDNSAGNFTAKPAAQPAIVIDEPVAANSHKSALDRLLARKSKAVTKPDEDVKRALQPQNTFAQPTQALAAAKAGNAVSAAVLAPVQPSLAPSAKTSASPVVSTPSTGAPISSREINTAVINSIDRLATSMFQDRKTEIDGMMAGMMRPMLQEWLEDNLSSLVERIVREEIERVSRGVH